MGSYTVPIPTMWEGHHPYLFIHTKPLQNKQDHYHYFKDKELRYREVVCWRAQGKPVHRKEASQELLLSDLRIR